MAAGLKTFAERVRIRYLLRTATIDVTAGTYQCSCARMTMVTIIAVSTAPLGNSQTFLRHRRTNRSTIAATRTADPIPVITVETPSPGAAIAVRINRTIVSRPLGVLKNRRTLRTRTSYKGQARRLITLEIGGHNEAFHAHPNQERDALLGAHDKGRSGESVGEHGSRRNDRGAGDRTCRSVDPWIKYVLASFIVTRSADGLIREAETLGEFAIVARMADSDRPRLALRVEAA